MKYSHYIIVLVLLTACGKSKEPQPAAIPDAQEITLSGKELFEGAGNCVSCHKPDAKFIAPSIIEIATIYKEQNGDLVNFLKGNGKPIVDPSQYEIMKTNFAITKNMSDAELQAIADYMYSHLE